MKIKELRRWLMDETEIDEFEILFADIDFCEYGKMSGKEVESLKRSVTGTCTDREAKTVVFLTGEGEVGEAKEEVKASPNIDSKEAVKFLKDKLPSEVWSVFFSDETKELAINYLGGTMTNTSVIRFGELPIRMSISSCIDGNVLMRAINEVNALIGESEETKMRKEVVEAIKGEYERELNDLLFDTVPKIIQDAKSHNLSAYLVVNDVDTILKLCNHYSSIIIGLNRVLAEDIRIREDSDQKEV